MTTIKSRKAKARRLQNWLRDQLLELFPTLTDADIKPALMGESGADIKLSSAAQKLLPITFECKNREDGFSTIYDAYEQAQANSDFTYPVVFIKQNRKEPLVVIEPKLFFYLITKDYK